MFHTVKEVDTFIRKHNWVDLYLFHFECDKLIVAGSTDLTYSYTLAGIFEEVFFVSALFQG